MQTKGMCLVLCAQIKRNFEDLEGFKFFDVINKIEMAFDVLILSGIMLKVNCAKFALYKVKRFRALWFWLPEGSFFIYSLNVEFILININAKESLTSYKEMKQFQARGLLFAKSKTS